MANLVARKTFKVQVEITVDMDELEDRHLHSYLAQRGDCHLLALQDALLEDESALLAVMRSRMAGALQEYSGYLAALDSRAALQNVVDGLAEKDRRFFRQHSEHFDELTRPLRVSTLTARVEDGRIAEKVTARAGKSGWRTVWRDLLLGSRVGKMLTKLFLPHNRVQVFPQPEISHYLVLKYLTQEVDGVHVQGHCTCDKPFNVCAEDESEALDLLWADFQEHFSRFQPARRRGGLSADYGLV